MKIKRYANVVHTLTGRIKCLTKVTVVRCLLSTGNALNGSMGRLFFKYFDRFQRDSEVGSDHSSVPSDKTLFMNDGQGMAAGASNLGYDDGQPKLSKNVKS